MWERMRPYADISLQPVGLKIHADLAMCLETMPSESLSMFRKVEVCALP